MTRLLTNLSHGPWIHWLMEHCTRRSVRSQKCDIIWRTSITTAFDIVLMLQFILYPIHLFILKAYTPFFSIKIWQVPLIILATNVCSRSEPWCTDYTLNACYYCSKAGVSNWQPEGRRHHTQATCTSAPQKQKKCHDTSWYVTWHDRFTRALKWSWVIQYGEM